MSTKVKICGITRLEDALCAAREGADFLGYIFYPPSKRFIAPRSAQQIIRAVRKDFPGVQHIGVFVDDETTNIAWVTNLAGLDYSQLHGREQPAYCDELDLLGIKCIKTVGISAAGTTVDASTYNVSYFLCDTHDEQLKGGTGRRFNLDNLPAAIPENKMFLAGGLNADNVQALLSEISPFAVDVSSGVEQSPGIKSPRLIKEFIQLVRQSNNASGNDTQNQENHPSHVSR